MSDKYSTINQWVAINRVAQNYKIGFLGLSILCLISLSLNFMQATQDPVVILDQDGRKIAYSGKREVVNLTNEDIKAFTENFIYLRYRFEQFSPDFIYSQIAPITTSGLSQKIYKSLRSKKYEGMSEKRVTQDLTNLEVIVTEESITASFDKVIRIDGLPLVSPMAISLVIKRGSSTKWNPLGLYVNGVVENDLN